MSEDVRDAILRGNVDILRDVRALFVDDHFFRFDEGFGDFGSLALALHFFPAIDINGELLFFAFELLLPALFVESHFLDGLEIFEAAGVGARGFGFVTVEEMHLVEVGLDPVGWVGLASVESLFISIDRALAAEHNPEIVGGAGDQSSVVVKRGLMLLEKVFE